MSAQVHEVFPYRVALVTKGGMNTVMNPIGCFRDCDAEVIAKILLKDYSEAEFAAISEWGKQGLLDAKVIKKVYRENEHLSTD